VSVARELAADIAQLSVDDERVWNYGVVFNGAEMSLRVTAFMDDVDAPDVAPIVPARLIEMIEAEMKAFFRGAG
jgi:hypothetical protein